jgi:hypothetical protein
MEQFVKAACVLVILLMSFRCALRRDNRNQELSYSYSFDVNHCPTGEHRFSTKEEYCSALRDDQLNGGCANQERMQLASQQGCP